MLDIALADDLGTVFMQEDVHHQEPEARSAFAEISSSQYVLYGGSDAGAHSDMLANESLPARALQWRVREEGSLTLEGTIHRFTAGIADAIGLTGRGRLLPGGAGDIAVTDLDTIGAGDAFVVADLPGGGERMATRSSGVRYTIVGGEVAFEDGQATGALPGQLLRSPGSQVPGS